MQAAEIRQKFDSLFTVTADAPVKVNYHHSQNDMIHMLMSVVGDIIIWIEQEEPKNKSLHGIIDK